MTSQQFLVCDNSTLTNFKQWAQTISSFFATAGWTQTSDTGQVNWSSIASVPGTGAYVYEVWRPGDALTTFYVKIEYGNFSGQTNCPSIRLTLSTSTNGAGGATGFIVGPIASSTTSYTAPSTTTQYECDFSGDASRIGAILWRNGINNCQQFFAIERSVNSSGTYVGTYVTMWLGGVNASFNGPFYSRTLHFTMGPAPSGGTGSNPAAGIGLAVRPIPNMGNGSTFNGSIPFDTAAPCIGYFDYPATMVGVAPNPDVAEAVTFQVTLYGATRTYFPTRQGPLSFSGAQASAACFLCMRYD